MKGRCSVMKDTFLGEELLVGLKPVDVSLVRKDAYLMLLYTKRGHVSAYNCICVFNLFSSLSFFTQRCLRVILRMGHYSWKK